MKIVVLPGLDGTGRLVSDFAEALRTEHDVEVVSYPGDMASYADISVWLTARLPENDFVIVAESFSGPLAIDIAATKPKGLKAAVFVAAFARTPRHVPKPLIMLMKALPVPLHILAWLSLRVVMGGKGTGDFRANFQRALAEVPRPTILGRLADALKVDKRHALSKIDVPCTYLRARRDWLVPRSATDDFAPICDAVISIDAPHFLLQARPVEAARHVSHFLLLRKQ